MDYGLLGTKAVVHPNKFISKFNDLIHNDLPNGFNFSRISIIWLEKPSLKKSAELINEFLNKNHDGEKIFEMALSKIAYD